MTDAERFELTLRVVQANLAGKDFFDALKPMSASACAQTARYIQYVLDGKTPQEAADLMGHD